jgi:hypothetical protein
VYRTSQHFETLYKDSMDEATEFRDKYTKSAKKVNKMEVEAGAYTRSDFSST